jgi:hypothetical protein
MSISTAQDAVFQKSNFDASAAIPIKGYFIHLSSHKTVLSCFFVVYRLDFNKEVNLDALMAAMITTGFQATNVGLAVEEINKMVCTTRIHTSVSYRH